MLKLSNGYKFDVACASGAFGFLNGWWWEQPLRWISHLSQRIGIKKTSRLFRPEEWTIFIKSLSIDPIKGNLRIWWPFNLYRNCVQSFHFQHPNPHVKELKYGLKVEYGEERGTINAVGLTNPSLPVWKEKYYPYVKGLGLNVILSVIAQTVEEGREIGKILQSMKHIRGWKLNWSCPNVSHDHGIDLAVKVYKSIASECDHPGGIKLGYEDPVVEIVTELQELLEWVTLINTVKWSTVYPDIPSPLAPWGLVGGVSGDKIIPYAREALIRYIDKGPKRGMNVKVPPIACGGIKTAGDVYGRIVSGAKAVQIGTFIKDDPIGAQALFDEVTSTMRGTAKKASSARRAVALEGVGALA